MEDGGIKKHITVSVILVSFISAALVLMSAIIYSTIKDAQEKEAQKYMKEIVSQYKNIIVSQIDGDLQTLEAIAVFTGYGDAIDWDVTLPRLKEEIGHNNFIRIGAVSPDLTGYFTDSDGVKHFDTDVSQEAFVRKALSGQCVVSRVMKDRFSGASVVCYGVPITRGGNIIGALTATRLSSSLFDIISQEIFGGVAYVHIIDREGNFIIRSDHAVIPNQITNIFDEGEISDSFRDSILVSLENGGDSFATFRYNGDAYWVTLIPVGINDWQIFCLVPQTFLNHNFHILFTVFLCMMTCIFFLFAILFLYICSLLRKERRALQTFAYKDILTGADNRNRFITELPALFKEPADYAMVLMNVIGFKFINEFYGFSKGNLLLKHIAAVLGNNIRDGERYYRDGADRFGMLVSYENQEELTARIKKIYREINDYTVSPNQDYRINCNFGVNIIGADSGRNKAGQSPDTAINGAQLALNSVSGNTANPIAFYDREIHEKARKKVEIESRMYAALANGEFHMYLQPKYRLSDGTLHSAEALVRWYSSDGSIHYPDEFIPVFEENGFITELDMYMLEEACRKISHWIKQGCHVSPISVNQSRVFFYDKEYLDKFHDIVDRYDIDPSLIILEVTESVAMSNLERVKAVIKKLHAIGFSISMDDFGSGYSSLNTLKDLDIAELKLDKNFLSEQSTSERGKMVIESVIHLARALSITTVAEGIENEVQLEFLKSVCCDIGQGYYFAKPMPAGVFEQTFLTPETDGGLSAE